MLQNAPTRSYRHAPLALLVLLSIASVAAASSAASRPHRPTTAAGGLPAAQIQAADVAGATAQPSAQPARTAPPLSLTLTMIVTCCSVGLVVGVIVLGFALSISNRKSQGSAPPPPS